MKTERGRLHHQDTKTPRISGGMERQRSRYQGIKPSIIQDGNERPGPYHQDSKSRRDFVAPELDRVASQIVDAAFAVHSRLGPGLLESVYEACLVHELAKRNIKVERQVAMPVFYDGIRLDAGLRLDLLVEGSVVVELKTVETILSVHRAQVLTYLKLAGLRLGLLINFNVPVIRQGIQRLVL